MKQPFNEATEIFLSEIHEKKKETALLRLATKGKRLGKKNVLFATDLMSRKEKLAHTKAGKVMTTNLYDNILTIDEFDKLEDYEKRNRLQYLRTKYSAKEIQAAMKTNSKRYYEIIKELNLPKAPRTKGGEKRTAKVKTEKKTAVAAIAIQSSLELEEQAQPAPVQEIIVNGMHLTFNGTYSAEHIIKQFFKYGALLEDETDEYYIELKLVQKQPTK